MESWNCVEDIGINSRQNPGLIEDDTLRIDKLKNRSIIS